MNGLAERSRFIQGDWFDKVQGKFDLIISNPPYIPSGDIVKLAADVRLYDPKLALDGGIDGLNAYRLIAVKAADFLNKDGLLLVEAGHDQSEALASLFGTSGYHALSTKTDLSGYPRVHVFAPERMDKKDLENSSRAAKTMARP